MPKDNGNKKGSQKARYNWNHYMIISEQIIKLGAFAYNKDTGFVVGYNWKTNSLLETLMEKTKEKVTVAHLKAIQDNYNWFLYWQKHYAQSGVSVEENKLTAKIQELTGALKRQGEEKKNLEEEAKRLRESAPKMEDKKLIEELETLRILTKKLKLANEEMIQTNGKCHQAAEIIIAQAQHVNSLTKGKRTMHLP